MPTVIVIGTGIVGLAIADALLDRGDRVVLVDRDPEGDKVSFGNAGGIAVTEILPASTLHTLLRVPGWLMDPLGPLAIRPLHLPRMVPWLYNFSKVCSPARMREIVTALSALNARVYADLEPMLARTSLTNELKRTGALTVYASDRQFAGDEAEWKVKAANGIALVKLSGRDVREMEPALSQDVKHGVLAPDWSLIGDPKRLVDKMRENVVARGARLVVATVGAIRSSATGTPIVDIENGQQLEADNVVVAAGVWSGALAANIGDKVLMESERGYNVTLPASGINLQREIIFAESKFVASPLDCGLRIGGSAEFGGVDAAPNYKRSWNLLRLAQKFLPNLGVDGAIPWAGHRSTTPDSLPVIGRSLRIPSVLYSFGHGHLGLTQAATNARLVADMIHDRPAVLDLAPFSVKRFN